MQVDRTQARADVRRVELAHVGIVKHIAYQLDVAVAVRGVACHVGVARVPASNHKALLNVCTESHAQAALHRLFAHAFDSLHCRSPKLGVMHAAVVGIEGC